MLIDKTISILQKEGDEIMEILATVNFDYNAIVSLISGVGFPIVCVIFMWKSFTSTLKELRDIISENTKMLAIICDKLDIEEEAVNYE